MSHELVVFYRLYRSTGMKIARLCVLATIVVLMGADVLNRVLPTVPLFLFNWLVMIELFYHHKVSRMQPKKTVAALPSSAVFEACTLPVMSMYETSHTGSDFVKKLASLPMARFLLERMALSESDLPDIQADKDAVLVSSLTLAQSVGGTFVTAADVVAAALLLEEDRTKTLFTNKIKTDDVKKIVQWSRLIFPYEEERKEMRVTVSGGGIGEALTSGWTPETQKYTRDFTWYALSRDNGIEGRDKEYETLQESLLKQENNNVVLVGEDGTGKEQLVRHLAVESFAGTIESPLRNKKILELLLGPLIAGAQDRSSLETRLQAVIEEVSHAGNVILYVPQMQNLLGSSSFNLDLSGALVPYLRDGNLPVISSISDAYFKTYLEKNPLLELFVPIRIEELPEELVEGMLMDKVIAIEQSNPVIITYQALQAAIVYGDRYKQESLLPGSAIDLIEDVVSTVLQGRQDVQVLDKKAVISKDLVLGKVEAKTKIALLEPKKEEKELLLHLEETLHQRVVGQNEAISVLSESMRRLRSGIEEQKKPISFLFLGPTGVGKTETAKTLATLYFGGEQAMIRLDMSEYADEEGALRLLGSLPGQGNERGELTEKVRDHPYSLLLLDEFEKAHQSILNLFLQVFEDGRLTDNKGTTVSFVNTIIIATSNAGSEFIREAVAKGEAENQQFQHRLLDYLQDQHIFKPELLNRFDDIVTFKPLTKDQVKVICGMLLKRVSKNLSAKDITITFAPSVLDKIATDGSDQQFGARPLRRYIQEHVEDLLAKKMLEETLVRGSSVNMEVDKEGTFVLTTLQPPVA